MSWVRIMSKKRIEKLMITEGQKGHRHPLNIFEEAIILIFEEVTFLPLHIIVDEALFFSCGRVTMRYKPKCK